MIPPSVTILGVTFVVKQHGSGWIKLFTTGLTVVVNISEVATNTDWQRSTEAFNAEMVRAFNVAKQRAASQIRQNNKTEQVRR